MNIPVVGFGCLLAFQTLSAAVSAQQLKIYHIDVDQADCTLFITPNGSTLLVDSGKNGHGERIKKVLQQEGKTRIDYFVNTHYHEDHLGGIDEVENDPDLVVATVYDRGDKQFLPASKKNEKTFKDYQAAVGNRAITLTTGTQIPIDNALSVTCISRAGLVIGDTGPSDADEENDMSLSLLITFGNFRYFVGGDIEAHTEARIADKDLVMDIDMYQANHHGSHSSSSLAFMQDMIPTVVVISNGSTDSYFHPRQVTLNTYASLSPPCNVFQTNKYLGAKAGAGNVADEFIADLDTQGDEGTIKVVVNSQQNNYVVSYRDKTRTFPTKPRASASVSVQSVVIESVMADPNGSDDTEEFVVIKNKTGSAVNLTGWKLQDASSRIWRLDNAGTLQANASLKIKRNGMAMTLNNDGDLIELIDPSNAVIDEFRYTGSAVGVAVSTGH